MIVGGKYKWKHEPTVMVYKGKVGKWHQFTRNGSNKIWCELLDNDLQYLEFLG